MDFGNPKKLSFFYQLRPILGSQAIGGEGVRVLLQTL